MMKIQTTTPLYYSTSTFAYPNSWKFLMVKAGMLGITSTEITNCHSLHEVQRLARRKFIKLAKRLHPDHLHKRYKHMRRVKGKDEYAPTVPGRRFRSLEGCYEWFRNLDEETYRFALKARVTVYDIELPLDWSGWHNYDSFYTGYRVSYWA